MGLFITNSSLQNYLKALKKKPLQKMEKTVRMINPLMQPLKIFFKKGLQFFGVCV